MYNMITVAREPKVPGIILIFPIPNIVTNKVLNLFAIVVPILTIITIYNLN